MNIAAENSARLWLNIKPATASTIRRKPKRNCVFNGTISISQALRKIEIKMPALRKVKVLAHAGNRQIEIIGDISHHHPGDNNQRTGQCVGKKANPCELDAIAVSHDWPAFKNKMA